VTDRREPFSIRLGKNRLVRSFFLGLATLAAALGFPVKVELRLHAGRPSRSSATMTTPSRVTTKVR
jgi:hypothetical protein